MKSSDCIIEIQSLKEEKNVKRFSKRIIVVFTIMMMFLTCTVYPTRAFAAATYDTQGASEDFKSFTRHDDNQDTTYYDIYEGQTKDRPVVDDLDVLMEQTLYNCKVIGTDHTPAQYWAAFANGVFAANPESYYSFNNRPYKDRFMNDVNGGRGYGNLYKALSSVEGSSQSTGKNKKTCDIHTIISGKRTAKNLNEVQEAAYSLLVEVKPGKIKTSDFRKHSSLKAMAEDDESDGTVMYNLMATRDRHGGTYRYIYNCLGIAYSDFSITPVSAEYNEDEQNNTGMTPALRGYGNIDNALSAVRSGTKIEGFTAQENNKRTVSSLINESTQPATQQITTTKSREETLSSTISHKKQVTFSSTQSTKVSIGAANDDFFHAEAGFSFTEGALWEDGVSDTNSTKKSESSQSTQSIQIPGHTGVAQSCVNTDYVYSTVYDCPVAISYTVTIFSYDGCYYDDDAATTYFTSKGYSQSAFMTQFKNANENLRERISRDAGYDESNGITRGIKVKHGYGRSSYDWDNPWIKHLDYSKISDAMKKIEIKPDYKETIQGLTENRAMSIAGGTLKRTGEGTQGTIGKIFPLYTLQTVKLNNANDSSQSVVPGKKLNLSTLEMNGVDEKDGAFYGFRSDKGSWVLADEDGNKVDTSDVVTLKEDPNGDFIVSGLKEGTAYVKYVVNNEAYQLYSENPDIISYVKSSDVKRTPLITINVEEAADSDANSAHEQPVENGENTEISETEKSEFLEALECAPGECSIAQATLLVKNSLGADLDLSEKMYVSALLQVTEDEMGSNSVQTKYETDAVVWATKEGIYDNVDREIIGLYSGITELEFAEIAYNAAKKYGCDVNCEDVSGEYAGFENLDDYEKTAMNWAISRGILTEDETASKVIKTDRIVSDKEAVAFFDNNPYSS